MKLNENAIKHSNAKIDKMLIEKSVLAFTNTKPSSDRKSVTVV